MNELSEDSETEDDDDEEDDDFLGPSIRPSKSVPDLNAAAVRARRLRKEAAAGRKLSPGMFKLWHRKKTITRSSIEPIRFFLSQSKRFTTELPISNVVDTFVV